MLSNSLGGSYCLLAFLAWNLAILAKPKFRFSFLILFLSCLFTISSTYNYRYNVKLNNAPLIKNSDYMEFYRDAIGAGKEYLPLDINYEEIKPFSDIAYDWEKQGYNSWSFCLDIREQGVVVFPKIAYAGYRLKDKNQDEITLNNHGGLWSSVLPKGNSCYSLNYAGTNIQRLSYILSIFGWFCITLLLSVLSLRNRNV